MSWLTPFARLVVALAKQLGDDPAHGIYVRRIDVLCRPEVSGDTIVLTYAFEHEAPPTGTVVVLAVSVCPLPLVSAQGHGCSVHGPIPLKGERVLMCKPLPGADWRSATVEICLAWPQTSTTRTGRRVLAFPRDLPALVNEQFNIGGSPQPVLHCGGELQPAAFVRALGDKDGALRQFVLYRGELAGAVSARRHVEIELGVGLAHLGEAHETRVISRLAEIVSFVASDLQFDLHARVLAVAVAKSPEYPALWGAPCISEPPSSYGESGTAQPNHAGLARSLAGLWWGAGCRLFGANAFELSFAICGALGLRWAAQVDTTHAAEIAQGYRRHSANAAQSPSFRIAFDWLLAIYESMCRSDAVMEKLRQLTREHYGYYVAEKTVFDRLTEVGVALSQAPLRVRASHDLRCMTSS